MGHDQLAFYKSVTGAASNQIDILADGLHVASGSNVLIPPYATNLLYALATETNLSDTIANARFKAPSFGTMDKEIATLNDMNGTASTTYTMPESHPIEIFYASGQMQTGEALGAYVGSSGTTAACLTTVVVGLHDGNLTNPYQGVPIQTARYTNAGTLTANKYTNGALTATNQTLAAGIWAVLGMKYYGATAQGARIVPLDSARRPGCTGVTKMGHKGDRVFRQGNLGTWSTFPHTSIPTIDFLANAADSSQTIDLDLVKVA